MFNLLPDSLKEKIKSDYKARRLALILVFVLFLQISFLIFITPSWLISLYKEKEAVMQTEKVSQSDLVSNASTTATSIRAINQKTSIINNVLEYPELVPYVDGIISKKSKSIFISQFSYTVNSTSTATLSIQGISATRESLVSFQKSVKDSGVFKSVDLPISNLAKEKNINFSMSLVISP